VSDKNMTRTVSLGVIAIVLGMTLSACDPQQTETSNDTSIQKGTATNKLESTTLNGRELFVVCQACHSINSDASHKVGPNLYGIINQKAASRSDFTYSEALKNSGLVWSKGALTGWIMGTETMVPGTWMLYHNHLTSAEATQLVEYIATKK